MSGSGKNLKFVFNTSVLPLLPVLAAPIPDTPQSPPITNPMIAQQQRMINGAILANTGNPNAVAMYGKLPQPSPMDPMTQQIMYQQQMEYHQQMMMYNQQLAANNSGIYNQQMMYNPAAAGGMQMVDMGQPINVPLPSAPLSIPVATEITGPH